MPVKPRMCCDFDDTIWDGDEVIEGCIETLTRLRASYRVAIYSARLTDAERRQMVGILDEYKVPYDEVLERKPEAVIYLDDKGFRFTSWIEFDEWLANRHTD